MDVKCLVLDQPHLLADRLSRCVVVDDSHAFSLQHGLTDMGIGQSTETTMR